MTRVKNKVFSSCKTTISIGKSNQEIDSRRKLLISFFKYYCCRFFPRTRKPRSARGSNLMVVTEQATKADAVIGKKMLQEGKGIKSERRMPRLPEARKDVVSCEKPRGFANRN